MTINPFSTELAAEHRRDLFRQADDYHRAKAARPIRRSGRVGRRMLRIRPVSVDDVPLLADMFDRLGPASRLSRFLAPKRGLTVDELLDFTDVDHHDHEALIGLTRLRGRPVGVARFIRDVDDPTAAEVAVEVIDEWHGRGVGSILVTLLAARARCENITQFTAVMSVGNTCARQLLAKLGSVSVVARDGTTVSYRVSLPVAELALTRRLRSAPASAGCAS